MSGRFMAEAAEKASADLSEALDGAAQTISRKLISETADREESALTGTLETEARNAQSFQSQLSDLRGTAESAENGVGEVTQSAGAAEQGATNAAGRGVQDASRLGAQTDAEAAEQARLSGQDGATNDPIDLVSGEMFLPQTDLVLPGTLPLAIERRHGSNYRHGRLFGTTWASTLDQRVQTDEDGIHFAAADGRVLHYPDPAGSGRPVLPSHGPRWPLSWDREADVIRIEQGDLGCVLHFPRGPVAELFRPLAAVTDRAGNRITLVYDADAVPTDVYHSGGYHLRLGSVDTRGGIRISTLSLADPGGGTDLRVREFRYDPSGRLVETYHADSDLPLVFDYDEADRIVRWADRNGHQYTYHYRADGRVSHAEGSDGFLDVHLDYDLEARVTTQIDALGQAAVHEWNDRLRTVRVIDPLGGQTLTERDKYGEIVASTDQLGFSTRIERDANGDPIRVERGDGSVIVLEYDARRLPVSATGPDGTTWRYGYDERGALTTVTDPSGAVTSYGRDERGSLTSITDPLGHTQTVVCDRAGLPVQVTDARGATRRMRRDAFGRIIEVVDAAGTATRLERTAQGLPLARRFADGSSETWEYDAEGNLLRHTGPAGAVTSYERGAFDLMTSRTGADGTCYQFTYDAQLRLCEVAGPDGRTWRYEYDAAGRLVAETDFNGARRGYVLDPAGRLVAQEGAAGQRIAFERDPLGRVTTRTAGPDVYRYAYDPAGRLTRAEGPGTVLTYARDPLGRVLSESLNGRALINEYDVAGRRTSRTTPGGIVSRWTHDPAGEVSALDGTGGALAFGYDDAGRENVRTLGPAASLTKAYDELGRLAAQAVWAFDRSGAEGSWRQVQERGYRYRADGLPTEVTDLLGGNRRYQLSAAGRVTAVAGDAWRESYAYDALGNLAGAELPPEVEAAGEADTAGARVHVGTLVRQAGRTTYEHDDAGRLVRQTRRTLSGQQRTTTYTWDAEDRLIGVATPRGEVWLYTYDPLGRRIAKTSTAADGAALETVWFSWDGLALAEQTQQDGDRVTTLTWDYEPGTAAPAAQTRRSWASAAPQAEIDVEFHAIVTDLVGTPRELVTPEGEVVWRAGSTVWGGDGPAPGSTGECPLRRPGQYHDAETGLYYNLYRYYDPAGAAYLSPDPLGLAPSPNPHAYVVNPLRQIDPLGLAAYDPLAARPDLAGKPIAVVGRLPDTSAAKGWPGHDVLDIPDWTISKNDDWVNGHIAAGNPVYVVSPLTHENLWDSAAGRETVTAREIRMFSDAGYKWDGYYLLPPTP